MPGGRLPLPKEARRRYNQPARGEWVDLEPLERPILPHYNKTWKVFVESKDKDGRPIMVRRGVSRPMWDAWRKSPVTSQYGPEDIAAICYLGEAFHSLSDASRFAMMDRLGLTPKGKRDLRWRTPNEVSTIKQAQAKAAVKRLRVVADDEEGGA